MHHRAIPREAFIRGVIAVLPLSLAVAPWGLLAGSMAIEANLSPAQGQGLSAIVFAGAAQLVAIGMLKAGAGFFSIMLTTLVLTSQHLLYGMSLRPIVSEMPLRWRMGLGFLLTDELFALTSPHDKDRFNRWYALGIGLAFYVAWNLFTLLGILLGRAILGFDQLGLDFSIAATFIVLITPVVRDLPDRICVAVSLFCSVLFSYWQWGGALVLAGLAGMGAGFISTKLWRGLRR
jgi:4-azaleucine resistance transporter AzlC